MPFSSLGLSPELLRAVGDLAYGEPTPVQARAIPEILNGHDVLALAQTGSGKTAAFCLPLLHQLQQSLADVRGRGDAGPRPARTRLQSLILVPTRELAAQIGEVIGALSVHLPLPIKTTVVFGGVSINPQMMGLRGGADLVVATPGRLLDLIGHNALNLSGVSTLVMDEADRLLDLGFADELSRVLALLPKGRQTLLFSATFPQSVQALADQLLNSPTRIEISASPGSSVESSAPPGHAKPDITQRVIEVDLRSRTQLLRHLVQRSGWSRVLVFVATKFAAEIVADKLRKADIHAEPFHGVLSQGKRSQVLADFKAGKVQVVVATDLAARGIDIAQLPVVVNFDLPRSSVDYVHRIGRTGRAGESGLAISFVSADTDAHFRLIEKRQGRSLTREQIEGFEPQEVATRVVVDTTGNGGIKGKRPSKKDKLRALAAQ